MKVLGFIVFLVFLMVSLASPSTFATDSPTADTSTQPKVNFFNPSRNYTRPVLNFFQAIGFRANFDFKSRYVWNGIPYSEGLVWQPSAAVEAHGFGVSVLGNFVLDDEPNQGQFNEVDFTVYYGTKIKTLEFDISFTYSIYPNNDPASLNFGPNDLNGTLHLAIPLGPLNLFSDISVWMVAPQGGVFFDFGIGYQRDLPLNFAVSSSLLLGLSNFQYNQGFIGNISGGANVFSYTLAFPWSPVKGLIITPQFNVSTLLKQSLRAAVVFPTNVWGDLAIGYNF